MATFVISDAHGRLEDVLDLIDRAGVRHDDFVLQLGDLANCVAESVDADEECLQLVGDKIDAMLVGNHEFPYFNRQDPFGGFHFNPRIDRILQNLYQEGLLSAAYLHEDILITHAGITHPRLLPQWDTAEAAWNHIETEWHGGNFGHSMFHDIGRSRGGWATYGGILWCDWNEMEPTIFPQIVGHTTGQSIRIKGNVTCIDAQGDVRADHRTPSIVRLDESI